MSARQPIPPVDDRITRAEVLLYAVAFALAIAASYVWPCGFARC